MSTGFMLVRKGEASHVQGDSPGTKCPDTLGTKRSAFLRKEFVL